MLHAGQEVQVWFQDEARIGRQGTPTTVWDDRGSRPVRVKQAEYPSAYLFASVNPATGANVALVAPTTNTHDLAAHLRHVSEAAGPGVHVVLVLDGAGWRASKALPVPANVTRFPLPPYSPELNPVERVWRHLRQNDPSNRAWADYDALVDQVTVVWNRQEPATLASITATRWLRASQMAAVQDTLASVARPIAAVAFVGAGVVLLLSLPPPNLTVWSFKPSDVAADQWAADALPRLRGHT